MAQTAKVFWSGRSQAVRLPKAFRLDAKEVTIRRDGETLVLEPVAGEWAWLDDVFGKMDEDFARAALQESPEQDRPELLDAFR